MTPPCAISGRNHSETCAGCIVSLTTPTRSPLKVFRSVSSLSPIARDSILLWEAVSYTRSARTIKRFSNVGIGVHVCNVTMSLPLTCPITQTSVGSVINTSLTRYL
jgi:hypothetical protein